MTDLKTIIMATALLTVTAGCTAQPATQPVQASGVYPDFTQAAESTINGVVSIKSYATPRQ